LAPDAFSSTLTCNNAGSYRANNCSAESAATGFTLPSNNKANHKPPHHHKARINFPCFIPVYAEKNCLPAFKKVDVYPKSLKMRVGAERANLERQRASEGNNPASSRMKGIPKIIDDAGRRQLNESPGT
jgi:hypothetical protein